MVVSGIAGEHAAWRAAARIGASFTWIRLYQGTEAINYGAGARYEECEFGRWL